MFTIDASVHVNAYNPTEAGSEESREFIKRVFQQSKGVYSPTLLLVEISTAVARAVNSTERGIALSRVVRLLPGQIWIPLDASVVQVAVAMGTQYRLRGSDAVYAAVARQNQTTLVTLDQQQLTRLSTVLNVCRPADALKLLN